MGDDFGDDYAAELEMMVGQSTDIAAAGQAQLLELEEALSTPATAIKPAPGNVPPCVGRTGGLSTPRPDLSVHTPVPEAEPKPESSREARAAERQQARVARQVRQEESAAATEGKRAEVNRTGLNPVREEETPPKLEQEPACPTPLSEVAFAPPADSDLEKMMADMVETNSPGDVSGSSNGIDFLTQFDSQAIEPEPEPETEMEAEPEPTLGRG